MTEQDDNGYWLPAETRRVEQSETFSVQPGPPRRLWLVLLALGAVALVFGVLILANIWTSVHLVTIFAGLFLVFAGAVQLAAAAAARRWGWRLVAALLTLAAGLVVVLWPEASLKALAVVVGVSFVLVGLTVAIAAWRYRAGGVPGASIFGIVLVVAGLVVGLWPGPTVAIVMALIGLSAVALGVWLIAQAFVMRRLVRSL